MGQKKGDPTDVIRGGFLTYFTCGISKGKQTCVALTNYDRLK